MIHGPKQKAEHAETSELSGKEKKKVQFSEPLISSYYVYESADIPPEELKKVDARIKKKGAAPHANWTWLKADNENYKTLENIENLYKETVETRINQNGGRIFKENLYAWNAAIKSTGMRETGVLEDAEKQLERENSQEELTIAHAFAARYYTEKYQKDIERMQSNKSSWSLWRFLFGSFNGNFKFDKYDANIEQEIIRTIKYRAKEDAFPMTYADVILAAELSVNRKSFAMQLRDYYQDNEEWTQSSIHDNPEFRVYINRDPVGCQKEIWDVVMKPLITESLRQFLEEHPEHLFSQPMNWKKACDKELIPKILKRFDKKSSDLIDDTNTTLSAKLQKIKSACSSLIVLGGKELVLRPMWQQSLPKSFRTYEFLGPATLKQCKKDVQCVEDAAAKYFKAQASSWFGDREIFTKNPTDAVNSAVRALTPDKCYLGITKIDQHRSVIREVFITQRSEKQQLESNKTLPQKSSFSVFSFFSVLNWIARCVKSVFMGNKYTSVPAREAMDAMPSTATANLHENEASRTAGGSTGVIKKSLSEAANVTYDESLSSENDAQGRRRALSSTNTQFVEMESVNERATLRVSLFQKEGILAKGNEASNRDADISTSAPIVVAAS